MAMKWSWAFGNESRADLESIGFTFVVNTSGSVVEGPVSSAVDPLNAYTYSGSPTRYGYEFDPSADGNGGRNLSMVLPAPALPDNKGIVTMAYRTSDAVFGYTRTLLAVGVNSSAGSFYFQTVGGTGTVSFHVDNVFKGTSAAMNASNWNYFAIVFDCSGPPSVNTFTGSLYVNGVLEVTASDSRGGGPFTIDAISSQTTQSGLSYGTNIWGQFITYDDPVADLADAVSPNNFVTRIVPNANGAGTSVGWTPTGAANNFQAVSPPIDNTTYAGIAAPSPGDRLEVDTASGTDLQTLLGINPSSIKGATVHSVSLATSGTAKVGIQEGGVETLSAAQAIQQSDTYVVESVANNPSTGTAWAGGDQPILVYEIDTV